MGNTPLTIGLKVENGPNNKGNVAGSILYGRIYLHNAKPVNAHSIRLRMKGIEEAVVHHTSTETRQRHHNHHHNSHHNDTESISIDHYERHSDIFFKIDHTIKELPGGVIPRGQFEFPFALQLPKSLPSSMEAGDGQSHCKVRYEIIAEVYQKPNTIFYKNPHATENLTVVAMPSTVSPYQDSSLHLPTEIVPISNCNCCCFAACTKIGTMALETKFDKTTLFLNETLSPTANNRWSNTSHRRQNRRFQSEGPNARHQTFEIQFRSENKSTEKVKNVKAKLVQTIEWAVNGHTASVQKTLAESTRDASMYSELDPMWHKPFKWQQHQYSNNESASPLLHARPWRTMDPALRVDGTEATDTYRGTAVKVRHTLSFSIKTQGCCSTNPDASAVVEIYRNPVAFGGEETAYHDPLGATQTQDFSPSAPFEEMTSSHASAPPSMYDDNYSTSQSTSQYTKTSAPEVPMAQAELVLPDDWNAYTEEVVNIPIVEATVVDS
eukprot:CAMPEP_0116143644 /NCGR_PEP_ID=MMETSP0329-20121206/15563_1 /TAXON_ID=697910 /ORGANISM="Pseudo-nitzschia arenysensis, Strain B593" /LENGTH=494 /DNA_ID=CAMNT_0003638983 /DNA_START=59 /DNA_END=1543 /DNA_ORIENTATION=+